MVTYFIALLVTIAVVTSGSLASYFYWKYRDDKSISDQIKFNTNLWMSNSSDIITKLAWIWAAAALLSIAASFSVDFADTASKLKKGALEAAVIQKFL